VLNTADETPNNGSYTWIPSGVLAGKDNYFMAICDTGMNDCTYTFDGRFAIGDVGGSSSLLSSTSSSRLVKCIHTVLVSSSRHALY
jgi:hypothetical protein